MAIKETILAFITTSVGLRYWYLSRRKGRYTVAKAKFKDYANVYGEMYAIILKDKDSVFAALKELRNEKLPANTLAYVQDFTVLLETVTFFSETSSQVAPPSIFEELFAFIKDVVEVAGVADINEYLKKNDLKITQNFADLCAFNGIKVDSSFIQVPLPSPVIFPGGSPLNLPAGGGNATLSWTTQYATSVTIDHGIGAVPVNGSKTINVTSSTTFTLTASNASGTAQSQVSVTVAAVAANPFWIGIQSWWNQQMTPRENFSSQLFSLPYVIPYIECFFSYNDGEGRSMEDRAKGLRDRVVETRDLLRQYHPTVPFNWGWWPHRYAQDGFVGRDDKLFYHKDDRLATGSNVVFTAHGRALFKAKTREFFGFLKPLLDAAGIPDPIFLDPDYEGGCGHVMATQDWGQSYQWHQLIMADPRATTELIDGVQTYAHFIQNLKDIDGNPVPENELFPFIYDSSEKGNKRANVYSTLTSMIVDYGLWDCLYSPAQEIWPNVLCGNWMTTASTRNKLVNGYRFKESPIDAGANFKGMQIASVYGNSTTDQNWWPVGLGFNTFNEQLFRFGIDKTAFTDKDALARKINTSYFEYFTSGMNEACPNGKKAISIAWAGAGSWQGAQVFTDPNLFPPEYIGAVLDYKAHPEMFDEIFASCRRNKVSVMEIFAENTNKSACDDMYTAFRRYQANNPQ